MSSEGILREVRELPAAIRATLKETRPSAVEAASATRERSPRRVYVIGNGTSFYAALAASYTARALAGPGDPSVLAMMSGDFRYFTPALGTDDAVVGVTASGEFRDVLATFEQLEGKCLRIGITHVRGSSITRLADVTLTGGGGPSRVPVTTKTYASTLTAAHLLMLELFSASEDYFADLETSADRAAAAISDAEKLVPDLVPELSEFEHAFCFGAGSGYAAALEGALKMKEMPLLHAEGSETWEMASGPSTMVDERALCIALYTGSESDEQTGAIARHARDWGARVMDIGPDAPAVDMHVPVAVPQKEAFASLALVAPVYLLAYRIARTRGIDPEKPHWRERYHAQGMTHIIGG
jgi:glucosamine--fructose-6-phosphate aminotransferase (isomerizing)